MTALDAVVLFVIGLSTLRGLLRGFVRSVITTAVAIVGIFPASHAYRGALPVVRPLVESEAMAQLLAFLGTYLLILGIGLLFARALHTGLRRAHLSWFDHVLGGLFGLLRGWAFCSIFYLALSAFPWRGDFGKNSMTAPYLARGAELISHLASQHLPRLRPLPPTTEPSRGS